MHPETTSPAARDGSAVPILPAGESRAHHLLPERLERRLRSATRLEVIERAAVREILMGAQDNLTNVLAVMLGVSVGAGRSDLVALAGLSAAVAEAVSMGGVLYSSTRAEARHRERLRGEAPARDGALTPAQSGFMTFVAGLIGGLVPLAPFAILPLHSAVIASLTISVVSLFALGSWTGRISGSSWWRDGLRLLAVAGVAALAAAAVGTVLRVS
jgi:VIT1/CCC1 family predicted Fe2+/Mn2+ transporter